MTVGYRAGAGSDGLGLPLAAFQTSAGLSAGVEALWLVSTEWGLEPAMSHSLGKCCFAGTFRHFHNCVVWSMLATTDVGNETLGARGLGLGSQMWEI